ncbi:MAG: NAD(P)-dependent glycerol-3-phosphate dehydrogenase [Chloroflexi bacterium]|nr:NAD(P)-dependent glycerol-3-phosphate dehydrogenase [Chloroflexota bacterium]
MRPEVGIMGATKLAVVGTGAWGVVIASQIASQERAVTLVARTREEASLLSSTRRSPRVPGMALPDSLRVSADLQDAISTASIVVMVVPAQSMRRNFGLVTPHLVPGAVVVSATKGLEIATGLRMTEVIASFTGNAHPICALSGPNLAAEIAAGKPASSVVACIDDRVGNLVQSVLSTPAWRIYRHHDVIGVELGGALKNVIALAIGIAEGLEAGENAKAALITRGLAEMSRLGQALGGEALTFAGLAGLGDLVATCSSPLSRNRTFGLRLARGERMADLIDTSGSVSEGVPTTRAALQVASRLGVELPITALLGEVIDGTLDPREAGARLLGRQAGLERVD